MKPGLRIFFILLALGGGYFINSFLLEYCINRECDEPWFTLGIIGIILTFIITLRVLFIQIRKLLKI